MLRLAQDFVRCVLAAFAQMIVVQLVLDGWGAKTEDVETLFV